MTDRQAQQPAPQRGVGNGGSGGGGGGAFPWKLQRGPDPAQLVGILTLIVSGAVLFALAGLTVAATVLGLIFVTPLVIVSSPVWLPIGAVLFFAIAGLLSTCAFGLLAIGGASWMYKYLKGLRPPGADRVDFARSRIADTASHVKDYARGYSGYLQGKAKDAAPGA